MNKVGSWQFERSSGFAGYRCQDCATWVHANKPQVCDCLRKLHGNVKVTFVPIKRGNEYFVRFLVHSSVWCFLTEKPILLPSTNEFTFDDGVFVSAFGNVENVKMFAQRNWSITKEIDIVLLGYDDCDKAVESKYNPVIDDHEWISRYV